MTSSSKFHFKYSIVKGCFLQSEDSTDDKSFDFNKDFGLINRKYDTDGAEEQSTTPWQRFERYVRQLNKESGKDVQYKVIYLGRHGQGWHNVAEEKYGSEAWDDNFSKLDGADGISWSDASLTEKGEGQTRVANELWKSSLAKGIPVPETYYVSPLKRAIQTANLMFKDLGLPANKPYAPVVKELLREAVGEHTCDRRSTASDILKLSPNVTLESGFSEQDTLWQADYREPDPLLKYRLSLFFDDVFAHDKNAFLSMTSHGGAIGIILQAIGHRRFGLETGGVIPVFVKAEKMAGEREKPPPQPSKETQGPKKTLVQKNGAWQFCDPV